MVKPRVLITGVNGKIGQALQKALVDTWDIIGVDKDAGTDVSDWNAVDRVFAEAGELDYVVHLAAVADSKASWDDVLKNNIVATRYIYERAKNHGGIKKTVFASTNHVMGGWQKEYMGMDGHLITLEHEVRPDGDYATSKLFGEALARQYWEDYQLRSICLRIGSVPPNNDPTHDERLMRIWLSHRDLAQLVKKSLESAVDFGIYYATSNNDGNIFDLSATEKDLGYQPEDNSATLVQ